MSAIMTRRLAAVACIVALATASLPLAAFRLVTAGGLQLRWPTSRTVLLQLRLDRFVFSEPLIDGSTSWNQVGASVAQTWNGLADVNFTTSAGPQGLGERGNNVNEAYFAPNYEGQSFGEAVGITLYSFDADTGTILEADVVFDSNRPWNAYTGPVRQYSGGGNLYDLRRVATHEFGHILGLGHPDDAGQSVSAIMNSRLSDTESVQQDDINGLRAIYGTHTSTPDRLIAGSTMQGDSNLVVYDMASNEPLWWTGASAENGQAIFQSDGNFVVYDGTGRAIWNTVTHGNPGAFMVLQNDGNLVLYSAEGQPLWTRAD